MKKLLALVVSLGLIAGLTGCGKTGEEQPNESKCSITLGLVTDLGGIDDKSFNEGTYKGILKFAEEEKLDASCYGYLQSNSESDYIPNLSSFAEEKKDLVAAPGFLFETAMATVADSYPDQKFLLIDTVVDKPNVVSAVFAENEGSFLVGVAAGLKAKEAGQTKFGFIGGMEFDLIQRFHAGFEAGVKTIIPEAEIMYDYAGDFGKPEIGKTLAAKQFDAGAYIVFHAAGGTGNGLIEEAKARREAGKDVWAIGVDIDQYEFGKMADGSSAVLTSMLKRVDVASYEVAKMVKNGEFKGGAANALTFNIANGGVGAEVTSGRNLSDAIIAEIDTYSSKVKDGSITVPTKPEYLTK